MSVLQQILLLISIITLFSGCRGAYQRHMNPFTTGVHTEAERNVQSVSNTQNPMKRPSYDEYNEAINPPLYDGQ